MSASQIAVVTDSTGYLPTELVEQHGLSVVPLSVVVGGHAGLEGVHVTPDEIARALSARRPVSTSRPSPERLAERYRELLDKGADGVVSVHMSARMSGTHDSAVTAAKQFDSRVVVVDSGSTGMGLGFAALEAARVARSGTDLDAVRNAAVAAATRTTMLFCVDSLEHLWRGGRIGAAAALVGSALSVRPVLHVAGGQVVVREKVRTTGRALARMVELAAEAAGDAEVDVAVHHLAGPDRAAVVAGRVRAAIPGLRSLRTVEVGAVVGAHVGPGLFGVVVYRRT